MTRVVVDEILRNKLHNLLEPIELCDESGQVIGRVLPVPSPTEYEGLESPLSKEELQRRKQNKGKTFSTAELLARLEQVCVRPT
jgi:hypothetical protein